MEAYYVMTYGAKSGSLPLLPPLFENNEAGGDFLAKEALDAVKDAEQKAAGILDTAAARCAAIRQDAAQKADKLKTERMQKKAQRRPLRPNNAQRSRKLPHWRRISAKKRSKTART